MRATIILFISMLVLSQVIATQKELQVSRENLAELNAQKGALASQIEKLEAQINSTKALSQVGSSKTQLGQRRKMNAQRVALAQSEGLLDTLKILFLNLALKIVEAVS